MERPASEKPGSYTDWYFFGYGHDYRKALGDYVRVAGRIPLPPRFAFGAWWSRYWAYSDQELDELVRGFRENDTPLDVLVIDMDWHISDEQLKAAGETDQSGQRLGWTGYTWNKTALSRPRSFLKNLHAEGLKTTLNLHPASGIQPWEQAYPAMARAMGIDPATKKYVPFDPTDKKWATNYLNLVLHPLEKQGIDFWWLDWQQQPDTKHARREPTWWLNYVHFTDQQREGKRPLLFHRWGGLGNHRYQIGFSGDTISVWDSLAFQPWFTATAANVGYAYWSHDIGGHMPGAVDPELYTRWVQFGAFSPILRTHTTKNPDAERRIWAYPEPYSSDPALHLPASLRAAALHLHRGAAHLRHRRSLLPPALLRLARRRRRLHQQERIHLRRPDAGRARDRALPTRSPAWPPNRSGCPRATGSSGPPASTSPARPRRSAASPSIRFPSTCAPAPSFPCSRRCSTPAKSRSIR